MRRAGYEVRVLAGRRLELRAEPADPGRIHPARSALVPGQHAVLAFPAAAGPAAGEPLSAGIRDLDVHRVAGLDRHAAARHCRPRAGAEPGGFHALRCRASRFSCSCWSMWFAPNIATVIDVLARPQLRRALRRRHPLHRELRRPIRRSSCCWSPDHVGQPHALSRAAAVRPHRRLGRAGARRPRGAVVARVAAFWPQTLLGLAPVAGAGADRAVGDSLCSVHRRRSAALDPAGGDHRLARRSGAR